MQKRVAFPPEPMKTERDHGRGRGDANPLLMPGARLERTPYSSMRVASSKVTGDVDMTAVKGGVIRCAARLDLRT